MFWKKENKRLAVWYLRSWCFTTNWNMFFTLWFRISEVLTSKIRYIAIFSTATAKICCWVGGVLKVCGLWKNIFCRTVCWGWFCIIIAGVNICMDLQKKFSKSVNDREIPCNDSAKTRFDSCNVSANVLRNCASSFASCNSSWFLCAAAKVFSKWLCLLSINPGTWFSSDLRFADEFA